ncbi:hypothetical protein DL95DRAFT_486296, partial [Leptodontidium sp. 2 PMI_412]
PLGNLNHFFPLPATFLTSTFLPGADFVSIVVGEALRASVLFCALALSLRATSIASSSQFSLSHASGGFSNALIFTLTAVSIANLSQFSQFHASCLLLSHTHACCSLSFHVILLSSFLDILAGMGPKGAFDFGGGLAFLVLRGFKRSGD